MAIKIKRTMTIGRYNLVNEDIPTLSDNHWIRQLSKQEVKELRNSCNDVLEVDRV